MVKVGHIFTLIQMHEQGKHIMLPNDGTSPYAWKNLEHFWNSYRFEGAQNYYDLNRDFDWASKIRCSVLSGFTGYYGDNVYKIQEDTDTGFHRIIDPVAVDTTNDEYVLCFFAKADGRDRLRIIMQDQFSGGIILLVIFCSQEVDQSI